MTETSGHSWREGLALAVVGAIILLTCAAGGVLFKFYEARGDAREASAVFDGIAAMGAGSVVMDEGSILAGFFREPFETVVFIFRDGSFLTFSTGHDKLVDFPISWMVESIVKSGRAVSGAILCAHNHFSPVGFTAGDRDSYRYLRGKGFNGVFGIFYTASGRFREMEER